MTEVVTGEAVVLDVQPASYPGRIAALLIDLLVQVAFLIALVGVAFASSPDFAILRAIIVAGLIVTLVGYPAIFETLSRGKTLGKMALGLRVIGDDGGPERFRQALVRALVGVVEIYMFPPVALISSMVSARGKRLGDVFAGTFVIQERVPRRSDLAADLAVVPPPLLGWAQALELSRLSDQTAEAAGSYLRRFHDLTPAARDGLGLQLATAVAAQVSPPPPAGTPPAAYLSAVLAVRRQREHARLAAIRPAAPPPAAMGQHPVPGQPDQAPVTSPAAAGQQHAVPGTSPAAAGQQHAVPGTSPSVAGQPAEAGEPEATASPQPASQPGPGPEPPPFAPPA